jgi:sugar O-acyltransferase (sialic acid O-acetyltransferase NeuD family)
MAKDQDSRTPNRARRLAIVGAGGHGRVVLDILLHSGWRDGRRGGPAEIVAFVDNNPEIHGRRVDGIPVLGAVSDLPRLAPELRIDGVVVAIGDNGVRRGLARQIESMGLPLLNAVHRSAALAHNAVLGRNIVVAAGVVVCAHCQVGDSAILNTGCIIDHQTMLGEGVHICPGVRLAGRVIIEAGAFIGIGATVVPKVKIGCEAVVGAGAVVLDDVAPLTTVVGTPARPIRQASASEGFRSPVLTAAERRSPAR